MAHVDNLQVDADNFSCAWTKDLSTGTPLLCVAGDIGKILIINVMTGELHKVAPRLIIGRCLTNLVRLSQVMEG
jgi:hypothetical protein